MNKLDQKGIGAVVMVVILLAVGVLGFVGWKVWDAQSDEISDSAQVSTQPAATENEQTETEKATKGTVITTGDSDFGTMLFDDKDQAIYIWEVEKTAEAECYDDCATAWPPVLTDGEPQASGDTKADLLGTTERTDGTTQVTYNGHPLYYYAHEGPGEVECHNISTHGGLWWVIQPNGVRAD